MNSRIVISERLQLVIKKLGWSQERLAKEMEANPSTVSRWVNGNPLSRTSLKRFLEVTGASENFMIVGQEPMFKHETIGQQLYSEASLPGGSDPSRIELHRMVDNVLDSDTEFNPALKSNIVAFDKAVNQEKKMNSIIEERMKRMEEKMEEMMRVITGQQGPEKKGLAS